MFALTPVANVVSLRSLDKKARHAVRIFLQYSADSPPSNLNATVGAFQVAGDQYIFDANSLGPLEIGPIKAIQYNVNFLNGQGTITDNDGDFLIYIPSTGEIIDIAAGNFANATFTTNATAQGCISVESSNSPTISFTKCSNQATKMGGFATLTLFDFEVAPWAIPTTQSFGL